MPELVEPTPRLHGAWLAAHREWGAGVHEDGAGLRPEDDVETPEGFAAWVERLREEVRADVHSAFDDGHG